MSNHASNTPIFNQILLHMKIQICPHYSTEPISGLGLSESGTIFIENFGASQPLFLMRSQFYPSLGNFLISGFLLIVPTTKFCIGRVLVFFVFHAKLGK